MVNWLVIILGGLAVVALFALLKLVRSVLRLFVAFIGAALVTWLAYAGIQWIGVGDVVPNSIFLLIGAFTALFLLVRR